MVKLAMGMAAAVMIAGGAAPAAAHAFNGADKIVRGDYAAAERDIVAQRGLYPDDIDLMLNLAAVYAATGREADARLIYRQVAARPDEQVLLKSGASSSSRALAAQALRRMPALVAAR